MMFRVVTTTGTEPVLYLPETALAATQCRAPGRLVVAHGARRLQADVVPILEPGRFLPVSEGAVRALGLVEGIDYRLRQVGAEVRIGPVIGILAARAHAELAQEAGHGGLLEGFLHRYPDVGGLVYLFAADAVRPGAEEMTGLAWVPDLQPGAPTAPAEGPVWAQARRLSARGLATAAAEAEPETPHPRSGRFADMARAFCEQVPLPVPRPEPGGFQEGRFPLPGAVWRRTGYLAQDRLNYLLTRVGAGIFNAHFFDKEAGFRLLSAFPEIRPHLPETAPCHDVADLLARLEMGGAAALKRQDGNSGYGLMRVERTGDGYRLQFREGGAEERFSTWSELADRLQPVLAQSAYLQQPWIDLPEYKGRRIDFRVMMQKDDRGQWLDRGILGRFGRPGSVVTNFVNAGYALPPDEALRRAFGVGFREAYRLKQELLDFALAVCRALDETGGCYGDLGLDIGMDRDRRIWLFEVNKLPFHELPLYAGDSQMYLAVKSGPLLYASYLAGFGRL